MSAVVELENKSHDGVYWIGREKFDSRLFYNEILYAEGLHKPFFRGKFHFIALLIIAFYLYDHIQLAKDNNIALIIGYVNIFGNFFCFFISSIYHTFTWSVNTEIILQKLDHIGISLWCHFVMYPIAFLLFPKIYGYTFITVNAIICVVNCVNIYNSKPSIVIHSLVPGSLVLFFPVCWYYMSKNTWWFMIAVFFFQIPGTIVFSIKKTPSFFNRDYLTFHEIFHVLSIGSSFFIYLTNIMDYVYYKMIE
jgi:predicted membrane channel-forming protein YqfA (hemolysin III family)